MRLLVATDGSAHAVAAVALAETLAPASRHGETPTILTVINHEGERAVTTAMLNQVRESWSPTLKRPRTLIRVGRAVEEILNEASEGHYTLIIVGEGASGRLAAWFGHSTTLQVISQAPCSIAIAKGEIHPLRKILLCDSGVRSPSLLQHFLVQMHGLLQPGQEVAVLHVMSQIAAGPSIDSEELQANAEQLIRTHAPEGDLLLQDMALLAKAHVTATPRVRHGFVVDEILAEARSGDYDLVVIGAHGNQGWLEFLLDDLARQIIQRIDRPVLLIRPR